GLKRPDCEEGFFFMRFSFVSLQRRLSLTIRKLRPDRMLFSDHSKSAAEIFGPTMFLPHLSIPARATHGCLQSDGTRLHSQADFCSRSCSQPPRASIIHRSERQLHPQKSPPKSSPSHRT